MRNLAFRRGIVGKGLRYSKDKVEKGVAVSKVALGEGYKRAQPAFRSETQDSKKSKPETRNSMNPRSEPESL